MTFAALVAVVAALVLWSKEGGLHDPERAALSSQPSTTAAAPPQQQRTAAEVDEGRRVFRKCQACHSLEPGKNMVGPI